MTLPKAGREVNDLMPYYSSNFIEQFFLDNKIEYSDVKIAILGYSFKTNSGDVRFSPMEKFVFWLFEAGFKNVSVFDSSIADDGIKDDRVVRKYSWQDCIDDADCVVFGAAHDDIRTISISDMAALMKLGGLVYDGRRYFSQDEIDELTEFGLAYQGIGRSSYNR